MSDEPQSRLLGWCQSAAGTKPDTYHSLCRVEVKNQFGVTTRCSCPAHDNDKEAD